MSVAEMHLERGQCLERDGARPLATRRQGRRRAARPLALVPLLSLLSLVSLGGCATGAKPTAAHNRSSVTTTAAAGTTAPTVARGAGPSSSGSTTAPTTAPVSSTTVPSASGGQGSPTLAPPAPGTYTYDQQGTISALGSSQSFPPRGTDVIDPPSSQGAGRWTQVWHSYLATSQPPDDTTFSVIPTGLSITSEVIRMSEGGQTITFDCSFSAPVQILDWPPTVGHRFSGSGNCTSPNNSYGSFTVELSGSVSGTKSTSIGGAPTTAYVISVSATTSGSVNSTSTETDWFDPVSRLDLYTTTQEKGTYQGIGFSSQDTRTLVSTRPS